MSHSATIHSLKIAPPIVYLTNNAVIYNANFNKIKPMFENPTQVGGKCGIFQQKTTHKKYTLYIKLKNDHTQRYIL